MSDLKQYGGISIPLAVFNQAAEDMRRADNRRQPSIHYSCLLDAALRSIWPGTGPIEVKKIKVSVG